jgi:hypothetical protein
VAPCVVWPSPEDVPPESASRSESRSSVGVTQVGFDISGIGWFAWVTFICFIIAVLFLLFALFRLYPNLATSVNSGTRRKARNYTVIRSDGMTSYTISSILKPDMSLQAFAWEYGCSIAKN